MITGARLKEELTANNKIVGLNHDLKTYFTGGEFEAGTMDGKIHLPALPSNAILTKTEAREFRGISDHESLHNRLTPLDEWKKIAQYCVDAKDPHGISVSILNASEDVRIERLGFQTHPGIKRNIQATVDALLIYQENEAKEDSNPAFALPVAITWDGRRDNGLTVDLPPKLAKKRKALEVVGGLHHLYEPDEFSDLLQRVATFMKDVLGNSTLQNYLDGVPVEESKKQSEKKNTGKGSAPNKTKEALENSPTESSGFSGVVRTYGTSAPYFIEPDSVVRQVMSSNGRSIEIPQHIKMLGMHFATALKSTVQNRMAITRQQNYLDKRKLIDAFNGKEKIWSKKRNFDRGYNTALSFLIDHSGSMRDRLKHCMSLVGSLAKSAQSVGVPIEITGFSELCEGPLSNETPFVRSGHLQLSMYKEFSERLCLKRLDAHGYISSAYTPDSEALEMALERIVKRSEKRRVLIVLTDGNSHTGKERFIVNGEYFKTADAFLDHRKSVLQQAREDGVEVYAIMVGHKISHEGYPADRILHVANFKELESKVFKLFFNAIAGGKA